MADRKIRILLADDHPMVRRGLAAIIGAQGDMEIVGEASNGQDAVLQTEKLKPHVVIMDASMPLLDGIEATRVIASRFADVQVIGFSMCSEEAEGVQMLEAGAVGYLCKTGPIEAMTEAIRKAATGLLPGAVA